VYENAHELTKPPANYIGSKMSLIDHFHSSIVQNYNCITMGSNFCFKSLMFLNLCLKEAMSNKASGQHFGNVHENLLVNLILI
jgi:hypothetical protein